MTCKNCQQTKISSWVILSKCVLLQIIFCSCKLVTTPYFEQCRSLPLAVGDRLTCTCTFKTLWSKEKTLIDLSYGKTSWLVSVSQNTYLHIIKPLALANVNLPIVCSLTLLSSKKSSDLQNPFPWPKTGRLWSEIAKQGLYNREYD